MRAVSGNSLYSHSESIKEGFIVTSDGIRVGICGRAVCEGDRILSVNSFSAVVIRIPSRRPGLADELFALLSKENFRKNVLIYSPPGGGKTTLLRELVFRLSSSGVRTAAVDSRYEICEGIEGCGVVALSGYPRAKGVEIAQRCLSPDCVVCDEISSENDLDAVSKAASGGSAVVATCHAPTFEVAERKTALSDGRALFDIYYGVGKSGRGTVHIKGDAS